jgi:large subunit ribosomal protein L7/L12
VVEEKTEFTVVLKSFDDTKKIPVIKEVRAITGLGLKEAKDLVEAGGKTLKENVSKEEAAKIKHQLETAGGVVEIQ